MAGHVHRVPHPTGAGAMTRGSQTSHLEDVFASSVCRDAYHYSWLLVGTVGKLRGSRLA